MCNFSFIYFSLSVIPKSFHHPEIDPPVLSAITPFNVAIPSTKTQSYIIKTRGRKKKRDRQTNRHRKTQTETDKQTNIQTQKKRQTEKQRQTNRPNI